MSHVFNRAYLHLVWRTKGRQRILQSELEQHVHGGIKAILGDLRLNVLAVNSAWDHVHVLSQWNTTCAIEDAVREAKSLTSRIWNDARRANPQSTHPLLYWQQGFGMFTIRHSEVDGVIDYIDTQKIRHRHKRLWPEFEITESTE